MRRQGFVALLVLTVTVSAASAQNVPDTARTRAERPYRGLFGSDGGNPDGKHKLNLLVSFFGSYDENVVGDQSGSPQLLDPRAQAAGMYGGMYVSADYERRGRRINFSVDASTSPRYYPDFTDFVALQHYASAALNGRFGRTTISLTQGAQYAPFYSLRFLPVITPDAGDRPDIATVTSDGTLAIEEREASLFNTAAAITHSLSSRGSISADYGVRFARFRSERETDLTSQQAGVHYRQGMTRYAALRAGYSLQQGSYATGGGPSTTELHTFDLGADYRRPLSFSRRTFINFNLGSSAVEGLSGRSVFRILGDAGLTHEMGRTWRLVGDYHRGAELIEGFAEPVFSDSVNASVEGFITRRLDLVTEAALTEGEVGMTGTRNRFDSVTASARLRWGITRYVACFGEYFYYQYRFARDYALPPGMPRRLDRQGVRVGLMLFVPVIQ